MKKVTFIVLCILSSSLLAVTFDCLDDANVNFYQYTLSVFEGDVVSGVILGTHDGQINNYSNWIVPVGWSYSIFPGITDDTDFYLHGAIVPPTGTCPYIILFSYTQGVADVGEYDFKFHNIHGPHVAAWTAGNTSTNWNAPVGLGAGPVHSPVPEPLTLSIMGMGYVYIMRKRKI